MSGLSFSSWHSLSSLRRRISFHPVFLSPGGYLKSAVANRLLCLWTKKEFRVVVNFSHGEITTVSDYYLRRSDRQTRSCVVEQMAMRRCGVINVFLVPFFLFFPSLFLLFFSFTSFSAVPFCYPFYHSVLFNNIEYLCSYSFLFFSWMEKST